MRRPWGSALLVLVAVVAGCGSPAPSSGPSVAGGAFALAEPTAGLDTLAAYRATLTIAFSGTQAGAASHWSQAYTLTSIKQPQTRILAYTEMGLGSGTATYPAFEGFVGTVHYLKDPAGAACTASFTEAGDDPALLPEPARLLPRVRTMTSSGPAGQVAGLAAAPFTFDAAAVVTGSSAQAAGSVWLAPDTKLVVKYSLELKGGHDVFDADTEGTMSWTYGVATIDPATTSVLPDDCPTPLPDVPLTADATNVQRFPGYVGYETAGDVKTVATFYVKAMADAGFTAGGDAYVGPIGTSLVYTKGGQGVQIAIATGVPTTVRITRKAPAGAPNPTPVPVPTTAAEAGMVRVSQALTRLMGTDTTPSVFPSYHLEYNGAAPSWVDGKVAPAQTVIKADVEGKNVHFTDVETKHGSTTSSDVYKIGDKSYEVVNGKVQAGVSLASMAWLTWQLNAVVALGIGSFQTTPAGTETLDGRTAEVYRLAGKLSDDKTGTFASFGVPITSVTGTVWVDATTGALLKATLDYAADVKDTSGAVQGSGNGHIDIVVSRIGGSPVALP